MIQHAHVSILFCSEIATLLTVFPIGAVTLRLTSPGEERSADNMRGGDYYNERCTARRRAPGCDPET